jgi:poly(A) polymerase
LLTGDDLLAHGLTAGPVFGQLLAQIRNAQLDGQIETKEQALDLVDRLIEGGK